MTRIVRRTAFYLGLSWIVASSAVWAQDAAPTDELETKSLPLRTALHHDPTLAAPLDRLVDMYRKANRLDDLVGMYRAHTTQYPLDMNGRTVFVRLLMASGDPESLATVRRAVQQFPQYAYLHFLLYENLKQEHDPTALDSLERAIQLEPLASRKVAWIDILIPAAVLDGRREMAKAQLDNLAELADTPERRLTVARKMIEHDFYADALDLLTQRSARTPSPETMVELEMTAATAEFHLKQHQAAADRLDRLLDKLTADYWQRPEIVRRRLSLVTTHEERQRMLAAARKRVEDHPTNEAAILDLAQMLVAFQYRRDALDVLLEAGKRLPTSEEIEKRTLELFDRLHEERGREQYLAERIKAQPKRTDLVIQHVRSLYLLDRPDDALEVFDGLLDQLPPADRTDAMLETARFLRRASLFKGAVVLFERVVQAAPDRLDVRRELAETYLAAGNRQSVHELFDDQLAEDAQLENLLDIVQFMIKQRFYFEAREALVARVKVNPANMELRTLLLSVERQLGNVTAGQKLIEETRKLADTSARYRLWLESAVAFHEEFFTENDFLAAERERLEADGGEWTEQTLQRRLTFADAASRSGSSRQVAALLQQDLNAAPPEFTIPLRKQLIEVLERGFGNEAAIQHQLAALAHDDPSYQNESVARMAILHAKMRRTDLAAPLLSEIDLSKINDATLLDGLKPLYQQQGDGWRRVVDITERLTALNPTNRGNWEQWLLALAATRDETRLRRAIRQLLAGIDKMPLSEESTSLLQAHLADSYWRSIGSLIADREEASLSEALVLLDAVERMAQTDQQWLWVSWTRAWILNQQERLDARDEAIVELERLASIVSAQIDESNKKTDEEGDVTQSDARAENDTELTVTLPDGLTMSFPHARELLTTPPELPQVDSPEERTGPSPPLKVHWDFTTPSPIIAVESISANRLFLMDAAGTAYVIDIANGKLIWRKSEIAAASPVNRQVQNLPIYTSSGQVMTSQVMTTTVQGPPTRPLIVEDQLFVPGKTDVVCYSIDDGLLQWRAHVQAVTVPQQTVAQQSGVNVNLFWHDDLLLAFEQVTGNLVKIDAATGKVLWEKSFPTEEGGAAAATNSGADLRGDHLLIYGPRTAIIDVTTGDVRWSFEPQRVRRLPVTLEEPRDENRNGYAGASPFSPTSSWGSSGWAWPSPQTLSGGGIGGSTPYSGFSAYSPYSAPTSPPTYSSYLQPNPSAITNRAELGLTAPAVVWAAALRRGEAGWARLLGGQMLLSGSSGLMLLRTDLPLASKTVGGSGELIGITGQIAVIKQGQIGLQLVNLHSGTMRQYSMSEIAGKAPVPVQVALDGALVYATGPGGILCINAFTGERVHQADWPSGMAPEPVTATTNVPVNNQQIVYSMSFRRSYQPVQVAQMEVPEGPPSSPIVARVQDGKMYTLLETNRLVVLIQASERGASQDGD